MKKNIGYKNGDLVCKYLDDRQVLYDGNTREEHTIESGIFTRGAVFYEKDIPYTIKKIRRYDKKNQIATGMYYAIDEDGSVTEDRKFIVDYKKLIETVYDTPKGGVISEISYLNRKDFSTKKTMYYYLSGNLCCLENKKTNLPHGTILHFYDSDHRPAADGISDTKRNLAMYEHYKSGILLKRSTFNQEGQLTEKLTADGFSRESYQREEHSYNDKYHSVSCFNSEYLYETWRSENNYIIERIGLDADHRAIYYETNGLRPINVEKSATESTKYFVNEWDETGEVISGNRKYYKNGILVSSGPFKAVDNDFIVEGMHISRDNVVTIFQDGKVIKTYAQTVMEENGELIVKPNDLSISHEPSPIKAPII